MARDNPNSEGVTMIPNRYSILQEHAFYCIVPVNTVAGGVR